MDIFEAVREGKYGIVKYFLQSGGNVEEANEKEETLLMIAAERGQDRIAYLLLKNGADPEKESEFGIKPKAYALSNMWTSTANLIEDFFEKSEIDAFEAIRTGSYERVKDFLESGGDVEKTNEKGETLLMIAAECGEEQIVTLLLEYGADPERESECSVKPKMFALFNGWTPIVTLIEEAAKKYDGKKKNDINIFEAVRTGRYKFVKKFLQSGGNVDETNEKGETLLMTAAENGEGRITNLLLIYGADTEKENEHGVKPATLALSNGWTPIAHMIEKNA